MPYPVVLKRKEKKKPTMACHLVEKEYINDSFNE